jgi:apolipoprotein N-acyltransferase
VSPTGGYGHPAYSQWSLVPVVQLASVFGIDGILFLLTW